MSWLIDTNIAIHVRDGDPDILDRISALSGEILMSIVSRIEMEGGVHQFPAEAEERLKRLDLLLASIPVLDFDQASATAYRSIIKATGFSRRKVLDRMIAAQSLSSGFTLITRNGDDFRDIPGLILVEW